MIKQLTFIGGISLKRNVYGGETIKNKIFLNYISHAYPKIDLSVIDTFDWKNRSSNLIYQIATFFLDKKRKVLILSVSERGASIFFKAMRLFFWVKKDIYYFITGTVPDDFIAELPILLKGNRRPQLIFSEIEKQKVKIEAKNLPPVIHISNWKYYNFIPATIKKEYPVSKLKVFTFSKIDEAKGTSIFFESLKIINRDGVKIEADLYGIIDESYRSTFENYLSDAHYCQFKNTIDLFKEENYEILSRYDLMVFPTYHKGEGFAGTIIDCFIAGVPVVASRWNYNGDIIDDGVNGYLFEAKSVEALVNILTAAYENQENLNLLRKNCVEEARKYKIDIQLKSLLPKIVGDRTI